MLRKNALPHPGGMLDLRGVPRYRMADEASRFRTAALGELTDALRAARCSAQLAGMETDEFVVRELLLTVIEQIDRAARRARRLYASP